MTLNEHPLANVDTHNPQWFIRDIQFLNYHINHDKWDWFKYYTIPFAHRLQEDFCCFNNDCWTITTVEEGQGSAAETCVDMVNGVLIVTNAAAVNDMDELVYGCECWQLVNCYPLYAEIRFKIDDPDDASFWFGLITGDTWWAAAPDDYVVFHVDAAGDDLEFSTELNGVQTNVDTGVDLADLTWYTISFHWDGEGHINWFVFTDAQEGGYCVATGTVTTTIPQDEVLKVGFGLRNDEAVAHNMWIDYFTVSQKRVID